MGIKKSLNQFWYGWGFFFLTLPRMFMVSIWGIPTAWFLYDFGLGFQVAAVGCILFDLAFSWRAPDVVLSKTDIETLTKDIKTPIYFTADKLRHRPISQLNAERDQADRFYLLTQRELKERLIVLVGMFAILAAISAYWFYLSREEVFWPQLLMYVTILASIGYVSAKGVTLRNKHTIADGETPVSFDLMPLASKKLLLYMFGWLFLSPWWWAFYWLLIAQIHHFKDGFDGSYLGFLTLLGSMSALFLLCNSNAPFALMDRKLQFTLSFTSKGE